MPPASNGSAVREVGQLLRLIERDAQPAGQRLAVELGFLDQPAGAGAAHRLGVGALMVVGGEAIGHQEGRPSEREQLGDAGRARPGDDQVSVGHAFGQVVEEAGELSLEAEAGVGARHPLQVLRAALLGEREPRPLRRGQAGDRGRHDFAEHPRALAAADHQHLDRLVRRRRAIGAVTQRRDLGPHRVAGDHLARARHVLRAARRREGQREACGAPCDQPIRPAEHRVLLVHQERDAQHGGGEADRHRGVAAERGDRARPRAAQQPQTLGKPDRQAAEAAHTRAPAPARACRLDQPMLGVGAKIASTARIAGDDHRLSARAQLGRQAQRRIHVPAGAAGRDHHRPGHRITSALGRRRVSARNSPMLNARAHSEDPP